MPLNPYQTAEYQRLLNRAHILEIASLRADIRYYEWRIDEGCGDPGYWERQRDKAQASIERITSKMESTPTTTYADSAYQPAF